MSAGEGARGRAVDQRRRLVEGEVPHVALAQIEVGVRLGRAVAGQIEHRRRRVDADDAPTCRQRDRDRDSAVAYRELDDRPICLSRESDVEGDVVGHVRRPFLVPERERLVPAHRATLPAGFSHTDTCWRLSLVNGSRFHPAQRSRSVMPASCAMRSSSAGHT